MVKKGKISLQLFSFEEGKFAHVGDIYLEDV